MRRFSSLKKKKKSSTAVINFNSVVHTGNRDIWQQYLVVTCICWNCINWIVCWQVRPSKIGLLLSISLSWWGKKTYINIYYWLIEKCIKISQIFHNLWVILANVHIHKIALNQGVLRVGQAISDIIQQEMMSLLNISVRNKHFVFT